MTQCRYINSYTFGVTTSTTIQATTIPQDKRHICAFCGGAKQYKTSEQGKRKVRK